MRDISVQYSNLTRAECDYLNAVYEMMKTDGVPVDDDDELPEPQFQPITAAGRGIAPQINVPTSPPPPAAQSGAPQLDAFSVPWHAAIHSANPTRTASGAWKLRKGVDKTAAQAWVAQHQKAPGAAAEQATQFAGPVLPPPPPPAALPPAPTAIAVTHPDPGYAAWYDRFMALHDGGRLLAGTSDEMMRQCGVSKLSDFDDTGFPNAACARARGISWDFMRLL